MIRSSTRWAATITLAFLTLAPFSAGGAVLATHSTSTVGLLAIDADPGGNTATSLGPLDGCVRVEENSRIDLDYIVDSIPPDRPIIGFEVEVRYDPQLLEAVEVDRDLLLSAVGAYSPFAGLSDGLPDSDGSLRIAVLDTASAAEPEANVERGAGVLARITFRAKAAGLSEVSIALETQPLVYPLIQDTQNETIFADRLGSASVAVGQGCPPQAAEPKIVDLAQTNAEIIADNPHLIGDPTPSGVPTSPSTEPTGRGGTPASAATASPHPPTPSNTASDDGSDTALIVVVVALLALATAACGSGWYLYQRSRKSSQGG